MLFHCTQILRTAVEYLDDVIGRKVFQSCIERIQMGQIILLSNCIVRILNTPTQISTPKYYAVYVVITSWKNPVASEDDSSPSKI